MKKITQAVILAGGMGVRLRPLTNDRPKPMVLLNGRPFLEYLIELLKKNDIEEVVLLLGYLPEKVIEHFGDGSKFGIRIKYHVGDVDTKNGTRVKHAQGLLDDFFLLMYCDQYWPLDLSSLTAFHEEKNVLVTMTVFINKDGTGEYGPRNTLRISGDGIILEYGPLTEDKAFQGNDIGFFIVDKKSLGMMSEGDFMWQNGFLPRIIEGGQVAAYQTDIPSHTITNPELLKEVEIFFKREVDIDDSKIL